MIEMTLSSRHRIQNSSPSGLMPSTLPLGHGGSPQYWLSHVDGEETCFVSFKPPRPGTPGVKGNGANHYPRAPALLMRQATDSFTSCLLFIVTLAQCWPARHFQPLQHEFTTNTRNHFQPLQHEFTTIIRDDFQPLPHEFTTNIRDNF